jgi:hypothetical protein
LPASSGAHENLPFAGHFLFAGFGAVFAELNGTAPKAAKKAEKRKSP